MFHRSLLKGFSPQLPFLLDVVLMLISWPYVTVSAVIRCLEHLKGKWRTICCECTLHKCENWRVHLLQARFHLLFLAVADLFQRVVNTVCKPLKDMEYWREQFWLPGALLDVTHLVCCLSPLPCVLLHYLLSAQGMTSGPASTTMDEIPRCEG